MKKILLSLAVISALTSLTLVASAKVERVPGPWNVEGAWVVDFEYLGGHYLHDAFLTQSGAAVAGNGGYEAGNPPYSYAWVITSGSISGDTINLTIDYTVGAIGTTMHMTGTIAPDGTISGIWDDNLGGGLREGTWTTASGIATRFEGNHGQYVSLQADKQDAAQSRIGMPVQSQGYIE